MRLLNFKSNLKARININHQIRANELRVITEDGDNLGVITKDEALKQAEEAGLDLIEISPNARPPVAKIMDYGKWQYMEKRKAKASKGSKATETKSVQIKIGTGDHDLEMKANRAGKFLKEGNRVKIELFLPGRSKYLDKNFLDDRLKRILKLVPENYKMADQPKKNPKGLFVIIERDNTKKEEEPKEALAQVEKVEQKNENK